MKRFLLTILVVVMTLCVCLVGFVGCQSEDPVTYIKNIIDDNLGSIWFYDTNGLKNEIHLSGQEFGYKSNGREGVLLLENNALVAYMFNTQVWTKHSDEVNINRLYSAKDAMLNFTNNLSLNVADYDYIDGKYSNENGFVEISMKGSNVEVYRNKELFLIASNKKPDLIVDQK